MIEKVDETLVKNHLCNEIVNYFDENFQHGPPNLHPILAYWSWTDAEQGFAYTILTVMSRLDNNILLVYTQCWQKICLTN